MGMRYKHTQDIVRLAIHMQGTHSGMTIEEIQHEFSVSRRTAERMRNDVEEAFGPLIKEKQDTRKHFWRLDSVSLHDFVSVSADELSELASAEDALDRAGLKERALLLRDLSAKLKVRLPSRVMRRLGPDLEALMEAEGLATRPGPRPLLARGLFAILREALKAFRVVAFRYHAQSTGRHSRRRVQPYGLLYGNRAFLVGRTSRGGAMKLWRLSGISELALTDESFERDPGFDLQQYAKQSFGVFQEKPVTVVLRFNAGAALDASTYCFHPDQTTVRNKDGSLTVKFRAGGINEMCWHLVTWGDSVTVEQPARLRQHLARMCAELARHHSA